MNQDSQQFVRSAVEAAQTASRVLVESLLSTSSTHSYVKAENDIETEADILSGKAIKETILARFPDHDLMFEESDLDSVKGSRYLWVIDSIGGTINFEAKLPHFGLNIALVEDGEPILGLNSIPYTDDVYVATKGQGAYHYNERLGINERMTVSNITDPSQTILFIDSGKSLEKRLWTARIFSAVIPHFRQIEKHSDSWEAGLLGTSKLAGYVCNSVHYWDFIAHKLIVEESGGKATDIFGQPLTKESSSVIYSNSHIHDFIVDLVKDTKNEV